MTDQEILDRLYKQGDHTTPFNPDAPMFYRVYRGQGKGVEEALLMTLENILIDLNTTRDLLERSVNVNHNHPVYDELRRDIDEHIATWRGR